LTCCLCLYGGFSQALALNGLIDFREFVCGELQPLDVALEVKPDGSACNSIVSNEPWFRVAILDISGSAGYFLLMARRKFASWFKSGVVVVLLFFLLLTSGIGLSSANFFGSALREVSIGLRDVQIQWMVVMCLFFYLITFLFVERRMNLRPFPTSATHFKSGEDDLSWASRHQSEAATVSRFALRCRSSIPIALHSAFCCPSFWLVALVILVGLRYAFAYPTAARHLEFLVLLAGIVVGKAFATWVRWPGDNVAWRRVVAICILVALLAASALWPSESAMAFHYRELHRWTGVWDNPNLYGLLMGVGLVLALGLAFLVFRGRRGASIKTESEPPHVGCYAFKTGFGVSLCVLAAGVLGVGLWHSYSRGAWIATLFGLTYLAWHKFQISNFKFQKEGPGSRISRISRLKVWGLRFRFPAFPLSAFPQWLLVFCLLASVLVLCFWQFRFSEVPGVRRVFSVGNINDFSWRNRVAAWEGAVHMMRNRPLTGFGWGRAEQAYQEKYLASRLTESAAFEMNDYFMLGTSAGVPALICFVVYVGMAMREKKETGSRLWALGSGQELKKAEIEKAGKRETGGSQSLLTSAATGATRTEIEGGSASSPLERALERDDMSSRFESGDVSPHSKGSGTEREEASQSLLTSAATSAMICRAGAVVLLIGFWFDGGLFKLATGSTFWILLELGKTGCFNREIREIREQEKGILNRRWTQMDADGETDKLQGDKTASSAAPVPPHPQQSVFGRLFRAAGRTPSTAGGTPTATIVLRWVAGVLAAVAVADSAVHLVPPHLAVGDRSLALARRFLVQAKERGDFEWLAAQPIWSGVRLRVLLDHVELSVYNRELLNWQLTDQLYRDYVLSPVITKVAQASSLSGEPSNTSSFGEALDWRRALWEEFYPRIRHENSPGEAAVIVLRHLHERVTVTALADAPRSVPEIWRRQVTDAAGFEIIAVAALRSVGVPARLDAAGQAEFWDGEKWGKAETGKAETRATEGWRGKL